MGREGGGLDQGALPPGDGGSDRARETEGFMDKRPVPVGGHGVPHPGGHARPGPGCGALPVCSADGYGRTGPGRRPDLRWWTGWPLRDVRKALRSLDVTEVLVASGSAFVLADDLGPAPELPPWPNLLPSLDPTVMGWRDRDWYLGDHAGPLFDRNGNAGPTVWCGTDGWSVVGPTPPAGASPTGCWRTSAPRAKLPWPSWSAGSKGGSETPG